MKHFKNCLRKALGPGLSRSGLYELNIKNSLVAINSTAFNLHLLEYESLHVNIDP